MTYRRIVSLVLALIIAAACLPLTFAEESAEPTRAFVVNDDGTETEITPEELEALREGSMSELPEEIDVVLGDLVPDDELPEDDGAVDITPRDADAAQAAPVANGGAALTGGSGFDPDVAASLRRLSERSTLANATGVVSTVDCQQDVSITQKGTTVTVKGSIQAPYYFYGLYVDTTLISEMAGSTVDQTINMSAFDTGYHTVTLGVVKIEAQAEYAGIITRQYMVSNNITEQPTYNGVFEVYHNYLIYYPYNMAFQNTSGDLYMEYSSDNGKTWSRSGYMRSNMIKLMIEQSYKLSGLKPGTSYRTRIRYGTFVTYSTDYAGDGKSHFFGGPVLRTTTIKTGAATRPPIKSVKAKAYNVKYHKVKHYGYYTGVYLYTEKFYTCKIKVIVKLKKKPGTNGMWINGKWVRGNKTSYTAKFSPYPNYYTKKPKGHYKYTVTVCSGQSKTWGGYSPSYSKTKTLS